jgi:Tfp pilus assembly protein PilE
MTAAPASAAPEAEADRPRWLFGRMELIIVILLGLVSLGIAYTSFESSLYDGNMQSAYAQGNNDKTEAESLYLEANQQYVQDTQTLATLAQLRIAAASGDATAQRQYDQVVFMDVSPDLQKAMDAAAAKQATNPATYVDPQEDADYQAALFGDYGDKLDRSKAELTDGQQANNLGDRLTLTTVLMAVPLFLLGVAAVIRRPRQQLVLLIVGMAMFAFASVLAAFVPFVWLG